MDANLKISFDRTSEILDELSQEYDKALHTRGSVERATHLTHEVLERLRSILDRIARRYWELHVAPHLSDDDKKAATLVGAVVLPLAVA
ncbi:hypothetical protein NKH52_09880 [Mesorhizobium sp. M1066]|uniref:hypothetical protein n=1 Tax=unclassified Mesorhizobium TaxID=325217 RepID=UPI0033393971